MDLLISPFGETEASPPRRCRTVPWGDDHEPDRFGRLPSHPSLRLRAALRILGGGVMASPGLSPTPAGPLDVRGCQLRCSRPRLESAVVVSRESGPVSEARRPAGQRRALAPRLFLAITPLLLTVVLAWLTMRGHLSLGAGDKDLFLAAPLLLWSLVHLCCFLALWRRRFSMGRSLAVSASVATGVLGVALAVLFGTSWFRPR